LGLDVLNSDERTRGGWESLYHLIILPMVREEYEVVKETFFALKTQTIQKKNF
jgi:hypothetical protein